jgi:hypothetical protein
MAEGWICIHRKIRECDIWDYDEPFSRRDAWIDLLLLANHRDKDTIFDGNRITIKRGQYLTSVRKLSKEWHWGKDKTLKYLRLLEQCEMITREADSRRTLITIVNYSIYQDMKSDNADSNKDSKQTVSRQSSATNNNDNNENNDNKKNNKFVPPTLEEVRSYCQERKNNVDAGKFIDFYASKGWMVGRNKMKDWKASVRTWERRDNADGRMGTEIAADEERRNRELDEAIRRVESGEADHDDDGMWD